jgi:hypothetical protein
VCYWISDGGIPLYYCARLVHKGQLVFMVLSVIIIKNTKV